MLEECTFVDASSYTSGKADPAGFREEIVAVIGLGYVGLPLCVAISKHYGKVIGFDINRARVAELNAGRDRTNEIADEELANCKADFVCDASALAAATMFIVTVPTPIDDEKRPDLRPLESACRAIGSYLKAGDVVVFESTVYPGITEEYCGPILEKVSGLTASRDFSLGYSPERINPGDKDRTVEKILKIVSADGEAALERVASFYARVIKAGIYRAQSIKVAECAKVIENTQRDVNIALMNELSHICSKIGISTMDVIEAAGTKWNFVKFRPGLVGGHCIGVDPYYLASLAERHKMHPQVILSGRRVNDDMAKHVAVQSLLQVARLDRSIRSARVGVFGITFKEDVPDIRNSMAFRVVSELRHLGMDPLVHDPLADKAEVAMRGIALSDFGSMADLDMMIVATPHSVYLEDPRFLDLLGRPSVLIDVKSAFDRSKLAESIHYWSL